MISTQIDELLKNFEGEAGVYLKNLTSGKTYEHNAEVLFPTASLIKVPIMVVLFEKIESGIISYNQPLKYDGKYDYDGESDIINSLSVNAEIELSKLIHLMINFSDNSASKWCQDLAGGGMKVNDWLSQHSFQQTRVNTQTPGRESQRNRFGWGQTTPKEMARILTDLFRKCLVSGTASEKMYRILSKTYLDGGAISQIPPFINAASKQGCIAQSRSEVILVNAPTCDYVLCVITDQQQDQSWDNENDGYRLIREISKSVWQEFEPVSKWEPGKKASRYYPLC